MGQDTQEINLKDIKIKDDFWTKYQVLVYKNVIPYQWDVINDRIPNIEPSHAVKNFKIAAKLEKGEFYGFVFQDSDLAKWLETFSYSLMIHPDPLMENNADEVIDIIEKAQQPDGYLNTYFTIREPGKRFTNMHEAHELYCAGHFIEAAVAYYNATGKRKLLEIMCRYADLIDRTFGPEPGKLKAYCGHPEIELALVKLYQTTGEEKYLKLSKYFIDERGREPYYFDLEFKKRGGTYILPEFRGFDRKYLQAHLPVRKQTTAEGHAVRVTYLFSAATDIARLTWDLELKEVCGKIWNNITLRRMYITGGIGSASYGEAFTCDYDLPNDTMYTETCASVGMVLFAYRMLKLEADRHYSDIMELQLYNNVLSGISLDGTRYFYVNPLEIWPERCEKNPGLKHVKPVRQPWYACSCCPPNVSRLIASLGMYIYTIMENQVNIHLYIGSEAGLNIGGNSVKITQKTSYPNEGIVQIKIGTEKTQSFSINLRIPGWCKEFSCIINGESQTDRKQEKGYLKIDRVWSDGDMVELNLKMPVTLIYSHPKVRSTAGKAVIQRGPVIYCLEEADNGPDLQNISLADNPDWKTEFKPDLLGGIVIVKGSAFRSEESQWDNSTLYGPIEIDKKSVEITAIPYSLWCNRKPGEMIVWIKKC